MRVAVEGDRVLLSRLLCRRLPPPPLLCRLDEDALEAELTMDMRSSSSSRLSSLSLKAPLSAAGIAGCSGRGCCWSCCWDEEEEEENLFRLEAADTRELSLVSVCRASKASSGVRFCSRPARASC